MWEPSQRYPDPAVQVLDASFNQYRLPLASVERLYTGCRWSEGPVFVAEGR
jgi:gluconolactonase